MSFEHLEANVLGSLMVDAGAWDRGGHMLRDEDFHDEQNREVFRVIRDLVDAGTVPDTIAVAEILERGGKVLDGPQYVAQVSNMAVSAANIDTHCRMLRDKTLQRTIRQVALKMQTLTGTGKEQMIQVQNLVARIENHDPREAVSVARAAREWLGVMAYRNDPDREPGLMTGYCDVDQRLGGMRPGDLIVIAGRPSMGKTALAFDIAKHNATNGKMCLVNSLEMDRNPLIDRMVANISGVPMGRIRSKAEDDDWPRIIDATKHLEGLKMFLDDEPGLTIQEIHSRARQVKRKQGLQLLVIDYIQLVETDRRYDNRRDHVAEVSRTLKRIAKELQIPVIVLSQLNRKCEDRRDRRPLMSDLYESGAVEQDADAIGFVYRDEVYDENTPRPGICELIWRKVRNGKTGTDFLYFDGATQRFRQADRQSIPQVTGQVVKGPYGDHRFKRSGTLI